MTTFSVERLSLLIAQHTANVCRTMLNVDVTVAGARPHTAGPKGSVVSLIGLTGRWNGSGVVSCDGDVARRLSGRMLMTDFADVNADVLDAIGELTNMIVGNVKEDIARDLGALAISTPTVIYGEGLQTRAVDGDIDARVCFACDGGVLEVHLSLLPSTRGPAMATPAIVTGSTQPITSGV